MMVNGQRVEIPATPYPAEWDDAEDVPAPRVGQCRRSAVSARKSKRGAYTSRLARKR